VLCFCVFVVFILAGVGMSTRPCVRRSSALFLRVRGVYTCRSRSYQADKAFPNCFSTK